MQVVPHRIGVTRAVTWRVLKSCRVKCCRSALMCLVAVVKVVQHESEHTDRSAKMRLGMVLVLKHTQQFEEKEAVFVIY